MYIFSGFSVQKADIMVESKGSDATSLCGSCTLCVCLRKIAVSSELSFLSNKLASSAGLSKDAPLRRAPLFPNYISSMTYSS